MFHAIETTDVPKIVDELKNQPNIIFICKELATRVIMVAEQQQHMVVRL